MAKATVQRDSELQQRVMDELHWDTRVEVAEIGVGADDGVVTLTGYVDSYAKRVAAENAAHRVPGARDVANDIQVHVPGSLARTDTEIAQAIRRALEEDVLIAADNIETTVSDGWATLKGELGYWQERVDAERAIMRLRAVRGITNMITVRPQSISAEQIRDTLEEALERRAEREAERLKVEVDGGTVTLSGRVRSWGDKRAVLGAAAHAPGVRSIVDHVYVTVHA
jgi:osmotically-inducible protein OsmY